MESSSFFRPLVFSTYLLENNLFGLNSSISHTINLIIHLCNIILSYSLSKILFKKFNIKNKFFIKSYIVALIFAIHPTQIEAIAWVSGRFDLMATFFSFISLIFFLKDSVSKKYIFLGSISWFLALFCKESAVLILPILIFIYIAMQRNIGYIKSFKKTILDNKNIIFSLLFVFILYLLFRFSSLNTEIIKVNYGLSEILSPVDRVLLVFFYIFEYTKQAIFPFTSVGPIHLFVDDILGSFIWYLYSFGGVFISFITIMGLFYKRVEAIFFTLFLIAISLVLQIIMVFSGWNCISDRFLYFPIFFMTMCMSIIISLIINNVKKIKKIILSFLIIWICFLGYTTYYIVPFWKNNITLWGWQYIKTDNSYARDSYLNELLRLNKLDILESEFKKLNMKYAEKGFDPRLQLMYSTFLVRKGDQESIYYLKGLLSGFVLDKNGLPIIKNVDVRKDYVEINIQLAQAYLFIKKDRAQALHILNILQKVSPNHSNVKRLENMLNHNQ